MRLISSAVGIAMLSGATLVAVPDASAATASAKKTFITSLVTSAQAAQRTYGIPAAVTIAQAAVNTDYGTTAIATSAKNLFNTPCTASLSAAQFAKLAESQVGKPYILGASAALTDPNPKAFDCSELVKWLFGRSGNPITDLAAAQYDATSKVSGSPKVGDLVFLRNNPARSNGIGHVAVLTKKLSGGDWEIIEARGHAYGVVKTTYSYWKARKYYAGLRRYAKLNFIGDSGVTSASAASNFQAGCTTISVNGKSAKYSKFANYNDSVMGHAAIVAAGGEYANARKLLDNDSAFTDAIAGVESSSAAAYAKSIKDVISEFDLTQYDVAPLSVVVLSGDTGAKVTAVQGLVTAAGYSTSTNGKFDSATVAAVKKFQKAKGLTADGQAGPNTLTAMMRPVQQGSSGASVIALKALLNLAGLGTEAGSSFGGTTTASLQAFQTSVGLPATGSTDIRTWSKLFMLLSTAPVPTVTGTSIVGKTLTAATAKWGPGSVDVAFQWYRGNAAIPGANRPTYALQPADAGQVVRVVTTGTRAGYTSVSRISAAAAPVTPATLTATPTPTITGSPVAGGVLTAAPGAWAPAPVNLAYQWYRGKTAIPGAVQPTYRLQAADYKNQVSVTVTGSKPGYFSVSRASTKTAAVKQGKIGTAPTPTISGQPVIGQALTADPGAWSPSPSGLAFQWFRDNTAISGATARAYTVRNADAGHTLKVKVTSSGDAFAKVSKTSAATAKISARAWATAPAPTLTGTKKVGKTITVKPGAWSPAPSFSYQWYRGTSAIKGATKASYKLTKSDKGKTVSAKVTARKSGLGTVSKTVGAKIS